MDRTKDGPTTVMPKSLLALAAMLLLARAAAFGYDVSHKTRQKPDIPWTAVDESQLLFSGQALEHRVEPKPDIEWKDVAEAEENGLAIPSGKPKLLKFYATWSEPCKRMESTVFVNKQVADLIKSQFSPLAIRDALKEEGSNPEYVTLLQKKYHVFAFPTLIVLKPDGEPLATLVGCSSALATYRFLYRVAPMRPGS